MATLVQVADIKCSLCEGKSANRFCYECEHYLCSQCENYHNRIPATKLHRVTNAHQIDKQALKDNLLCKDHGQDFIYFCQTCEELICSVCVTTNHDGHRFKGTGDIAKETRTEVKKKVDDLQKNIKEIKRLIDEVKSGQYSKIKNESEHFKTKVEMISKDFTKVIVTISQMHITRANDYYNVENQQLQENVKILQRLSDEQTSLCEQLENVLTIEHDVLFFLNQRLLNSSIGTPVQMPQIEEPRMIENFDKEEFIRACLDNIKLKHDLNEGRDIATLEQAKKEDKIRFETRIAKLQETISKKDEEIVTLEEKIRMLENYKEGTSACIARDEMEMHKSNFLPYGTTRLNSAVKFQKQFLTSKGLQVTVVQEDITQMNVDIIVCPQDDLCLSRDGIAKAIGNISNETYRNSVTGMRTVNPCEVKRINASPSTLPFKAVLHTVAPKWDNGMSLSQQTFTKDLALTIRNVIQHCSDSTRVRSVAIPVLGVGTEGQHIPAKEYASILANEISKALQSGKCDLDEIYVIANDWKIASSIADHFDTETLFGKVTSYQRQRKNQPKEGDENGKNYEGQNENGDRSQPKENSSKLGTTVKGGNLDDCVICMDTPTDARKLKCGHIFCNACISPQFKVKPVCPTCGSIQGIVTGDQPPGTMKVHKSGLLLPGYSHCGRIEIFYHIYAGKQQAEHPNPGQRFDEVKRTAYLPDNRQGNKIAKLLQLAFDRKLVFTIGHSRTTGKQGVVTWNDIHHKTSPNPGAQFGYPDSDYLDRVTDELAVKGVTEKDL